MSQDIRAAGRLEGGVRHEASGRASLERPEDRGVLVEEGDAEGVADEPRLLLQLPLAGWRRAPALVRLRRMPQASAAGPERRREAARAHGCRPDEPLGQR